MSRQKRILLVENNADALEVVKLYLEIHGYQVYAARSPTEASRLLGRIPIHLAILDLRLIDEADEYDISGLTLAKDSAYRAIPKIILTAYPAYDYVREALGPVLDGLPPAVDFLAKQDGPEALLQAIGRAFQTHVRINFTLPIEFAEGITALAIARNAFQGKVSEGTVRRKNLHNELIDLFQRLFYNDSAITVIPFVLSFGTGTLVKVIAKSEQEPGGRVLAVQIGSRHETEQEVADLKRYSVVFAGQKSVVIDHATTLNLGGIVYSLIGVSPGEVQNLERHYRSLLSWQRAMTKLTAEKLSDAFVRDSSALATQLAEVLDTQCSSVPQKYHRVCVFTLNTASIFRGLRNPPGSLPLLFLQRGELQESDLDDIRYLMSQEAKTSRCSVALLVLFCEGRDLERARSLLSKLATYACDVVILDRDKWHSIVTWDNPQAALRRLVLPKIDLVSISPFVTTGPTPEDLFFGRESELREITEHASTASYALVGGRCIGKTSILYKLCFDRLPAFGFVALYHDCSTTLTLSDFLDAVNRAWCQIPIEATGFGRVSSADVPRSFDEIVNRLVSRFPQDEQLLQDELLDEDELLPQDELPAVLAEPLVILLDEVDGLLRTDRTIGYPLFKEFRGLAQSGRCQFVFAGERVLREALSDPNSPLFNFANKRLIGRLGFSAVVELVTKPMRQLEIHPTDEEIIVHHIYDFTSGHPSIVQRLCHRLILRLREAQRRQLTPEDVEAVVTEPDFMRYDFLYTFWERASVLEELISLLMARDNSIRSLTNTHKTLSQLGIEAPIAAVDAALERLVDLRTILKRTQTGYEFAVMAFPRVLAQSPQWLDEFMALNCDLYHTKGDIVVPHPHIPEES